MAEWFNNMDYFEKMYWMFAIPSSLVFLIVLVMTIFGGDAVADGDMDVDVDTDVDTDGGGFQFFTFRNLVAFFTIFSWSGLSCIKAGYSTGVTLVISIVCGLLMMVVMTTIFYFLTRMVEDGTMRLKNAIGRTGEVYLPIKGKNQGFGKVQISIQGSVHEIQAITHDEEDLKVGTVVQVTKVIDNHILLVTTKFS